MARGLTGCGMQRERGGCGHSWMVWLRLVLPRSLLVLGSNQRLNIYNWGGKKGLGVKGSGPGRA